MYATHGKVCGRGDSALMYGPNHSQCVRAHASIATNKQNLHFFSPQIFFCYKLSLAISFSHFAINERLIKIAIKNAIKFIALIKVHAIKPIGDRQRIMCT